MVLRLNRSPSLVSEDQDGLGGGTVLHFERFGVNNQLLLSHLMVSYNTSIWLWRRVSTGKVRPKQLDSCVGKGKKRGGGFSLLQLNVVPMYLIPLAF